MFKTLIAAVTALSRLSTVVAESSGTVASSGIPAVSNQFYVPNPSEASIILMISFIIPSSVMPYKMPV